MVLVRLSSVGRRVFISMGWTFKSTGRVGPGVTGSAEAEAFSDPGSGPGSATGRELVLALLMLSAFGVRRLYGDWNAG